MSGTVLVVVGTRPEAIKLAPVVEAVRADDVLAPVLVTTGQHPEMADEALGTLGLAADRRLDLPPRGPDQAELLAALLPALAAVVAEVAPDAVVVQGDTASALAGALAGFWARIPVAHVEAGLRTASIAEPFPEEGYRRMITQVASLHLAPTPRAAARLRREGVDPDAITCTGNTVVDAAIACAARHPRVEIPGLEVVEGAADGPPLALLTVHRRESWGEPLRRILQGTRALVDDAPDLRLVVPVHPNPLVRSAVHDELGDHPRIVLTGPLPHPALIWLLSHATVVLTDSGGIQEEATAFGTPVLVLRDTTERPEAVAAGTALLAGTAADAIHRAGVDVLAGRPPDRTGSTRSPFGDGRAAPRVVAALRALLCGDPRPEPWHPPAPEGDRSASVHPSGPLRDDSGTASPRRVGRPVLSPPPATSTRCASEAWGELVEIRRGGQVVRHLPGRPPAPSGALRGSWRLGVHQADGPLWIETAGSAVELEAAGALVVLHDGMLASRAVPGGGRVEVTVVAGRAEVRPADGAAVPLGPRETADIGACGTVVAVGRVGPDDLRDDTWVAENRALSHARPAAGRLATDPLLVLSDV